MMRPFFSYYGGKYRAAPRYPQPGLRCIVEPFAGSAGYAMRYHDRDVILVDADPVIAGLWAYLIGVTSAEILALPDLEPGQRARDLASIPQEARWLIGFWLNQGTASPRQTPSRWMRDGLRPGSFWGGKIRERIAAQVDKIRHWRVACGSYEIAEQKGPATYFVDPPYEKAGVHYKHGSRSIDYASLGGWCRSLHGQVIVCEQDGAAWLPFAPFARVHATSGRGRSGFSCEAVWTNDLGVGGP